MNKKVSYTESDIESKHLTKIRCEDFAVVKILIAVF
jgi:hypothetical protein